MKAETRKILVLYVYDNHHELVETTTTLLGGRGFRIDALCVSTFRVLKKTKITWPWLVYLADFCINKLQIPRAQGLFYNLFGKKLFKRIIDKYDFIDFQSFPSSQSDLGEFCVKQKKEFMISFWGSDALRANDEDLMRDKKSLDGAKYIKLNKQIAQIITNFYKKRYGVDYSSKYRGSIDGVTIGNKDILLLDSLTEDDIKQSEHLFNSGYNNKILVTIGYNGNPVHNHDKAISMLSHLPQSIKEQIHIVFPMTYNAPSDYLVKVNDLAMKSGITYTILDKFLSNKEICVLRFITGIFVMLENTDGFASSVKSHVYCQNVCIIADWLDYPLDNNNVYYKKVNWDNLFDVFKDVVINFDEYHNKCISNKEKMRPFMTWDKYVNLMCNLYN